jgi:hypothetical protein
MVALALWEQRRCGGCGGDLDETTSPHMEDGYEALLPVRCHRCTALSRSEERYRKPVKGQVATPHPHALIHQVRPKPGRTPHPPQPQP